MIRTLLLLIFMFLSVNAFSDNACNTYLKIEKDFSKKTPMKIDSATELTQLRVNCSTKSLNYIKRIIIKDVVLAKGWEIRKQRQHTLMHCNKAGLASTIGWTAIDTIYDEDYKYLTTLITKPTDCD